MAEHKLYNMEDATERAQFYKEYDKIQKWENIKDKIKKAGSIGTIFLFPFFILFAIIAGIASAGAKECKKAEQQRF